MKRWRPLTWLLLSVACFIGALYFWRLGEKRQPENPARAGQPTSSAAAAKPAATPPEARLKSSYTKSLSTAPIVSLNDSNNVATRRTNGFAYRLSNTPKSVGALSHNSKAILLENALIDSSQPLNLGIPDNLKSHGDPGSYVVQANGTINNAFREQLKAAGLTIVSYIPNNAYLVTGSAAAAAQIGGTATVIPWEPYYKVKASLMRTAIAGGGIQSANAAVFPNQVVPTMAALAKMGVSVTSQSPSPFGTELALQNVQSVADVANLSGVELIEPAFTRVLDNDLTRVIDSVSSDVFVPTNYLNLSGSNVLVEVNDSWIPTNSATVFNPDLTQVIGPTNLFPVGIADTVGHATHVSGIIGSSGNNSPTNAMGSQLFANFRGKAPLAGIFAMPLNEVTDAQLQEAAAKTNALISNNSWGYNDNTYDLAAASYDQAVRDSLPGATGSQSILYVFAAGNSGQGSDDGTSGEADSLSSPGLSKNSLTVGASELPRNITNQVFVCDPCNTDPSTSCSTNQPWLGETDSSNQVASFSSRGNVGIGVEGDFGRFKPDVVAPGTFVVSTRSMTWDTKAYYNPVTEEVVTFLGDSVATNSQFNYSIFVPCDSTQLVITAQSINPTNVPLPIVVNNGAPAPPILASGTNTVTLPPPPFSPADSLWFYSVVNPTNVPVRYDITAVLTETNSMGDYFDVLRTNLNDQLLSSNAGPNGDHLMYRYETGTSMSTPAVAGMLALMEDFFTNRWNYTPSPALLKALVINGARSINPQYDFQVKNDINYQGWGLVNLTNSLPANLTNSFGGPGAPMVFVDQSPTNALATGDSQTYNISLSTDAQQGALRITLVWTDPPGNPAASIKLVNDLDLIVTNTSIPTNPPIYFGNNFDVGSDFSTQWNGDTNSPLPLDNVNNVENIYIPSPLGSNYSITVFGHAVNVNAVTANTNGIVQDFALVVSSDNGEFTNGITITSQPSVIPSYMPNLTTVTNEFPGATNNAGALLLNQHVGASSPLQGTNTLGLGAVNEDNWGTNGQITLGVTNQWHFYVITNTPGTNATQNFTNAAFITFLPPTLSIPPVGVNAPDLNDATRPEADIDLYVARISQVPDPWDLTNLNPAVIAAADKSLSRGGEETIIYTNAKPNEIFWIGVKSEDQEAAEYGFAGLFSLLPFSQMGPNGEEYLQGINVPTVIPDGSTQKPGVARTLAIAVEPIQVRRVVVTNFIEHQNFGDLVGDLSHNQTSVVLNNHTLGNGLTNLELIYEDNGQGDIPGSQHSDGPGSLTDFIGKDGTGLWMLTEQDTALFNTGQVDNVFIKLEPQQGSNGVVATIEPNTFFFDFIDVPPNATNLTVCVSYDPTGFIGVPVDLFVRFGDLPSQVQFDYMKVINPPGDCLSIDRTSLPPLKPGRYFVGVFNPNSIAQTIRLTWTIGLDVNGVTPVPIISTNVPAGIPEDAVTNNTITITNDQDIVTVNVGVVLTDPRVSDLDLTLVSPTGQRILLFENRGGDTATNMGHLNITTNTFGQVQAGSANASTNVLSPVPNQGVLIVNYNFFTVPDQMDVFFGGQHIFHSGFVAGANTFTIPYGPANPATNALVIVMNQGNNPVSTTEWVYTPFVVTEDFTYLTFTDDTNLTQIPIKFAIPPFDDIDNGTNIFPGDFDFATASNYFATPAFPTNFIPDASGGWSLVTNPVFVLPTNYYTGTNLITETTNMVSVFTDPFNAFNGTNILALANGSISRVLSLTPARNYTVSYLFRGPGIGGWWRGEGNGADSADAETLGNNGDLIGRFDFPAGEVGQAFSTEDSGLAFQFAGTNTYVQVRQSPSLNVASNSSGFTVEGWINPTNVTFQQPVVEWLNQVPTNSIVNGQGVSNIVIEAGPFLNPETGHYYYLLGQTDWITSEFWANALGGHLAEVDDANEEAWIYDNFAQFGLTNHTMWIGLTNGPLSTNFVWSTGNSNIVYTNWAFGEPTNCPGSGFVAILGPTNVLPGLWTVLNDQGIDCSGVTNKPFGVVEVNEIQTNGVQLWISVTNSVTNNVLTGLGRIYANIMDTNNVPHEVFTDPGVVQTNVFQHIALTYNTNTGIAKLYYNGTNIVTTNIGVFVPNTTGDLLLGKDMSRITNNFFFGLMDEMSIYSRYLSDAEIASIYNISASTTNRNLGKFNPALAPAESLAEAQVVFGGVTNLIFGVNDAWQVGGISLKTTSNSLPVQITGLEPGVLLDAFSIVEQPPGNLYYLPEQALDALVGSNALGNWTLEIRDSRTGQLVTNTNLISWELQFILQSNTPIPVQLSPQAPTTETIPPGGIGYYVVNVPSWARAATNILVASTNAVGAPAPVSLLFNQTFPPESGNGVDVTFVNNNTAGSVTIFANPPPSFPPLLPGQAYFLAVTNGGSQPAIATVEVDFDIITLTNGVPFTASFNTNDLERPFIFNVSNNASAATFQLIQVVGGNADLVLRKGLPIPSLSSADYGAFQGTNVDETIYVLSNSFPVSLSAGPWYLDVIKRVAGTDTNVIGNKMRYAVLAKELDQQVFPPVPNIINLSNGIPFTYIAPPGAALTNYFRFGSNNFTGPAATNHGVHFELFDLNGNGDLTVQTNGVPMAPPFFQASRLPNQDAEFVFIHTNSALTNLALDWMLGVPNDETNNIRYTILGVIDTNEFASFPAAEGAGSLTRGGSLGTNVYHVVNLNDSGAGSLRAAVTATNGPATIVFDVAGTIELAANSPLLITNSFLTIAGQTAPNPGITIDGAPTVIENVNDIILRYIRFRPQGTNISDSLQLTNTVNIVLDHISAAFGTNNILSVLNSSNVTVQWSVLADTLNQTNFLTGGSEVRFGFGDVTLHHNLYANNFSASPRLGDDITLDFVNNVIFNWGVFAGLSTNDITDDPGGFTNFLNYSANYLIAWTNSLSTNVAFYGGSLDTFIFQTNNFIDTNLNNIVDGANMSWGMFSNQFTEFNSPFLITPTAPDEAFIAYEKVLDFAGTALGLRDPMDRGIVQQARLQGVNANVAPALLSGMASWWPGEGNGNDIKGVNNATVQPTVTYAAGEVGQAFEFLTTNDFMEAPASPTLNVGAGTGLTMEGWINVASVSGLHPIAEWDGGARGEVGVQLWLNSNPAENGALWGNLVDTSANQHVFESAQNIVQPNAFQHVAMTYDKASGVAALYLNGALVVQTNFGTFLPQTTTDLWFAHRPFDLPGDITFGTTLGGALDEFSIYDRALSACEIGAIFNAGSAGKQSLLAGVTNLVFSPMPPFADVDQDGIPDFWEMTLPGEFPTNFSATADRDGDGYTDLEEYLNWLGAPHALTPSNNPVAVDLYVLAGNTGNLRFGVQNGTNGTVILTNSSVCGGSGNTIAVFTPTNNFGGGSNGGFGSFSFMVTNNDTVAFFGPVTVSVFASSVPITNANTAPFTFTNPPNVVMLEQTTNTVTNTAVPPTGITYMLLTNDPPWATIDTNTGVITLTPGICDGPTNATIFTVATDTNIPPDSVTNQFTVTVLESNQPPVFTNNPPPNITNSEFATIVVTNGATNVVCPDVPLTYQVCIAPFPPGTNCVGNATISANGIINWTPTAGQTGLFEATTIVTDHDLPAVNGAQMSATNVFFIFITAPAGPYAFTQPAQAVTGPTAQLNGMATPNGLPTVAFFEWGTNTAYTGAPTPAVPVGTGFTVVYVTNQLTGLVPGVPYHYRLVVSNAFQTVRGFDQIFDVANVVVWGANFLLQSQPPPNLTNVTAIAGAYDHSLALRNNETVVAWGDNTFTQTNVPAGLNGVLAVSGGQYSSMALTNTGRVRSWGGNVFPVTNVPPFVTNVVMIADGTDAGVALQNTGNVLAWGSSFSGETNLPPTVSASNIVEIASGNFHGLAIKNDGSVVAWGDDSAGQTTLPSSLSNVVAVSGGNFHSLALRKDGIVIAWGDNSAGQTNVPPGLSNVVAIAAGGFHSLALKNDGTIVGWGDNSAGQTTTPAGLTNVVAISAGNLHSLALTPLFLFNPTNIIILPTTNGQPETNIVFQGQTIYLQVNVPTNADFGTNIFGTISGSLNMFFTTNNPPTITNAGDFLLVTNAPSGSSTLSTSGTPHFTDGAIYYLGFQNTNSFPVSFGAEVDFHLVPGGPQTNTVPISTIIQTNINGSNGFLLTWFAPSNDLFMVQWASNFPPTWNTFSNIVSFDTNFPATATNAEFQFFDDGSQTGGFSLNRFYQLILLGGAINPPVTNSPPQTNTVPISTITLTNIGGSNAFNLIWFAPSNDLFMVQWASNFPPTWNTFSNIVSYDASKFTNPTNTQFDFIDNGSQTGGFGTTRYYQLILLGSSNAPAPPPPPQTNTVPISGVITTNVSGTNNFLLVWFAPSNELFQVQWAASFPPTWNTFSNIISYDASNFTNPTNTQFDFLDNGSQSGGFGSTRFYQLILLNPGGGSPSVITPSAIPLVNGVPLNFTNSANATNFFSFDITQTNAAVLFELYNLSGNGDLTLQRTNLPTTSPQFSSTNLGTNYEQIVLRTNTGPANLNAVSWFLGVPNKTGSQITYTIRAVLPTNGMLVSGLPINTAVTRLGGVPQLMWGPTVVGEKYEVQTNANLGSTNWGPLTTNVAVGTSLNFTDPTPPGTYPTLYYLVVQIP